MTGWDRIKSPNAHLYNSLLTPNSHENLNKLTVIKVNDGLGTSMGTCFLSYEDIALILFSMTGVKSALEVNNNMTFLDLTVHQIEHLNKTNKVNVPLILMTPFNTCEDTLRIIKKYANQQLRIMTFNQLRYPHILKETLLPCPKWADDDKKHRYPPVHGDLYNALLHSSVLDQKISEGKEYLFVSSSDNLGAV